MPQEHLVAELTSNYQPAAGTEKRNAPRGTKSSEGVSAFLRSRSASVACYPISSASVSDSSAVVSSRVAASIGSDLVEAETACATVFT